VERRQVAPTFALAWALAGCATAPDPDAIASCPTEPDPGALTALADVQTTRGDPARGAALFARECAKCHSRHLVGRGSRLFHGYPRLDCRDYLERASDAYLLAVVGEGGPAVGRDEAMKPFRELLGDRGLADVIAHLRTLPHGER
jgi:mono/diheme cytochrome c family protein